MFIILKNRNMFKCLSKRSFFIYRSKFHNFHVNTICAIHKVNKDLMLNMLSQYQNWYIPKDLCLVHSQFSNFNQSIDCIMMRHLFKGSSYIYFCSKMQLNCTHQSERKITVVTFCQPLFGVQIFFLP